MPAETLQIIVRRCLLGAVFLLFVSARSFAAWTALGDVTSVFSHNGHHVIQTNINESSCGSLGKFYWPASGPDAKDMLAIALAALTADKQVRVSGDFVSPNCLHGGAEVGYIMIQK